MKNITHRFIEFYEYLISQNIVKNSSSFSKSIQISSSMMNEIRKLRSNVGVKALQNTVAKYDFLNPEWLLIGKGSMLKRDYMTHSIVSEEETSYGSSNIEKLRDKLNQELSAINDEDIAFYVVLNEERFMTIKIFKDFLEKKSTKRAIEILKEERPKKN